MPKLAFVHGFTQTPRSWAPVIEHLQADPGHVSVDLPVGQDLANSAASLGRTAGEAVYVGYSMGGRVCLRLAVDQPDLVNALVLIGVTPGIEDETERRHRRASDEQLATQVETDGVEVFLHRWLAQPMFEGLAEPMIEDRMRNSAWALAMQLRLMGTGAMHPLWDSLPHVTCPVLLVAGSSDTKFVAIARRMRRLLPNASFVTIEGAGHPAHLEQPHVFTKYLEEFLDTLGRRTSTNPSTG